MSLTLVSTTMRSSLLARMPMSCPSYVAFRQLATSPTIRMNLSQVRQDSGPVKFTKSGAYNLNPLMANMKKKEETPWFQGPVVAISTACLLIYFTCLREENDLDDELAGRLSLYDRVDGLEKQDLINSIKFNEENGMDTTKLKQRLKLLLEEESSA
eukprot:GFUD01005023.1.p1 GENE.GFUD01005023.1~~GFUD01005023.1.p1  ORF type:complete len:156 (-),score=43.86 GFUD01005023.1:123-590(-)